jgi:putative FmdB family regulatory protein
MPIYEYQCEACEHVFEKLVFQGDTDEITCPCCCSPIVKKVLSAASILNGSTGAGACSSNPSSGFS